MFILTCVLAFQIDRHLYDVPRPHSQSCPTRYPSAVVSHLPWQVGGFFYTSRKDVATASIQSGRRPVQACDLLGNMVYCLRGIYHTIVLFCGGIHFDIVNSFCCTYDSRLECRMWFMICVRTFVYDIFNDLVSQIAFIRFRGVIPPVFRQIEALRQYSDLAPDKCRLQLKDSFPWVHVD